MTSDPDNTGLLALGVCCDASFGNSSNCSKGKASMSKKGGRRGIIFTQRGKKFRVHISSMSSGCHVSSCLNLRKMSIHAAF